MQYPPIWGHWANFYWFEHQYFDRDWLSSTQERFSHQKEDFWKEFSNEKFNQIFCWSGQLKGKLAPLKSFFFCDKAVQNYYEIFVQLCNMYTYIHVYVIEDKKLQIKKMLNPFPFSFFLFLFRIWERKTKKKRSKNLLLFLSKGGRWTDPEGSKNLEKEDDLFSFCLYSLL